MMIAFKILMVLCMIISFFGSIAEKDEKARKSHTVVYGVSGALLLLAIVATYFL